MIQEARLTIDLKSLAHNYSLLRSMLKEETDLIAVVKPMLMVPTALK